MLKNQKGITLVALVVTIIILVILATISISIVVNQDLIGAAKEAKGLYENQDEEFNKLEGNTAYFVRQEMGNALASTNMTMTTPTTTAP